MPYTENQDRAEKRTRTRDRLAIAAASTTIGAGLATSYGGLRAAAAAKKVGDAADAHAAYLKPGRRPHAPKVKVIPKIHASAKVMPTTLQWKAPRLEFSTERKKAKSKAAYGSAAADVDTGAQGGVMITTPKGPYGISGGGQIRGRTVNRIAVGKGKETSKKKVNFATSGDKEKRPKMSKAKKIAIITGAGLSAIDFAAIDRTEENRRRRMNAVDGMGIGVGSMLVGGAIERGVSSWANSKPKPIRKAVPRAAKKLPKMPKPIRASAGVAFLVHLASSDPRPRNPYGQFQQPGQDDPAQQMKSAYDPAGEEKRQRRKTGAKIVGGVIATGIAGGALYGMHRAKHVYPNGRAPRPIKGA